jgi:UDP-glucose 4-epimerase
LSKLAGEHLLRLYGLLHGFSACSLRLFNVFGPRQAVDHPYANVTCKFSHAAAKGLSVTLYGDGEQARDFIYVDDVVNAFLAVLNGSPASLYNVGSGKTASIKQLIAELSAITGGSLDVVQREAWPNDVRSIRADASAIAQDLGVVAGVPLRQGLERTVAFHR